MTTTSTGYIRKGRLNAGIVEAIPNVARAKVGVAEQLSALVEVARKLGMPEAAKVIRRQAEKRRR